jgi:hypothetical protein
LRTQAWSSGGGTQSAAIAALITQGVLKPDIAVIVDTEREVSETWEYHEKIIVPNLRSVGVEIHRVPKSKYATVDLWGGPEKDTLLIPAFTKNPETGKVGKFPTYCSNEWKARVVKRFLTAQFPNVKGFDIWIGMSANEADRMRTEKPGKWKNKYPLVEDGRLLNRKDCVDLVRSMGWPDPPRSRCWMCPNQGAAEWADLEVNHPKDFKKAMTLETAIQRRDPAVFLRHDSASQGHCMSGMCYV